MWSGILSFFKSLAAVMAFVKMLLLYLEKRESDNRKKEIKKTIDDLEKATDVKSKAQAVCRLEKISDPNSDCDKP